eukprot:787400-Pyramimonas_sp.AAC.3
MLRGPNGRAQPQSVPSRPSHHRSRRYHRHRHPSHRRVGRHQHDTKVFTLTIVAAITTSWHIAVIVAIITTIAAV